MNKEIFELLITFFNSSNHSYQTYLNRGKTFQYAQDLKIHNSKALKLLVENKQSMPENLQGDIQLLIEHYTEWSQKWEKLAAEKDFQPDDEFVFANDVTFPKQAAQNLEAAFQKLK